MVQYVSDGTYDDHFVLFNNPLGTLQYTKFLGTGARDESPSIINAPKRIDIPSLVTREAPLS